MVSSLPIIVTPESRYGQELARFEQHHGPYTSENEYDVNGNKMATKGPGNPYKFRPFPTMLYRASQRADGRVVCLEGMPHPHDFETMEAHDRACQAVTTQNERCQLVVNDESERAKAFEAGWRESPVVALEFAQSRQDKLFEAAAHRAHEDRNMSDLAKAESTAAEEAAGAKQVPEVLRQPVRRRGRPRKDAAAVA